MTVFEHDGRRYTQDRTVWEQKSSGSWHNMGAWAWDETTQSVMLRYVAGGDWVPANKWVTQAYQATIVNTLILG
jgi:hypothetical protein